MKVWRLGKKTELEEKNLWRIVNDSVIFMSTKNFTIKAYLFVLFHQSAVHLSCQSISLSVHLSVLPSV